MMKVLWKWRSLVLKSVTSCVLVICLAISLSVFHRPVAAQSVSPQTLNNFNTDFTRLRSRVNRLEDQLRNDNRITTPNISVPERTARPPAIVNGRAVGASDPLLERLSTLLIELKEDVNGIDERLTALEAQVREKNN
jgi:hypothetical protein